MFELYKDCCKFRVVEDADGDFTMKAVYKIYISEMAETS